MYYTWALDSQAYHKKTMSPYLFLHISDMEPDGRNVQQLRSDREPIYGAIHLQGAQQNAMWTPPVGWWPCLQILLHAATADFVGITHFHEEISHRHKCKYLCFVNELHKFSPVVRKLPCLQSQNASQILWEMDWISTAAYVCTLISMPHAMVCNSLAWPVIPYFLSAAGAWVRK